MPAASFRSGALEYRLRFWIHLIVYALGFAAVPLLATYTPGLADALSLTPKSTWLVVTSLLAREQMLNFTAASYLLLAISVLFTGLGAWFRVWGAAYLGAGIVQSQAMQGGQRLLADGPYLRSRNPLYLGTLLHTVGIAILMPPAGALFAVAALWILQFRLALAEEPFLTARFGQPYLEYKAAVPRFLPVPEPLVPATGAQPRWGQAVLGECYVVGVFVTLACFGWEFNATPLYRGILISLGVSLIVRAFLPKATETAG